MFVVGQCRLQHGLLTVKLARFSSTKVVQAEDGVKSRRSLADWGIIRQMLIYLWPKDDFGIRVRVLSSVCLLIGAKALNVQVPFYFRSIIDSLNIEFHGLTDSTWTIAGAIIVAYGLSKIMSTLFQELRNAIFASVAQRAIRNVACDIFKHLMRLDLGFHLSKQTGGLIRAIDRGTKGISFLLSSIVFHIIPTAVEILLVCSILSYQYGYRYAIVTAATMLAYATFTVVTTSWRTKFRKQANSADNDGATSALDSLLNVESVKYFNNEQHEINQYNDALQKYETASIKVTTSLSFLNSGQNLIFSSALAAMMYMSAGSVVDGSLTVGDLVMINQLVFQLSMPLNFLGSVYRESRQSLVDMNALFDLQRVDPKIKSPRHGQHLHKNRDLSVSFENVTFGYKGLRPILSNVSFTIAAGQRAAFVGLSGCGKSTILRLLYRLYDLQSGRILINDQDIKYLDLNELRRAIGLIPQETSLFNSTIRQNIEYGRIGAELAEIEAAAQKSQLHLVINSFPAGYETKVGERGLMISGGEKQRLAIARAYLKDAPILLCDEVTAALDGLTEEIVMRNIKSYLAENGKTAIFIAHRLRTILDCDKIIVLHDGHVSEGSHESLLKGNNVYQQIWNTQELLGQGPDDSI